MVGATGDNNGKNRNNNENNMLLAKNILFIL